MSLVQGFSHFSLGQKKCGVRSRPESERGGGEARGKTPGDASPCCRSIGPCRQEEEEKEEEEEEQAS